MRNDEKFPVIGIPTSVLNLSDSNFKAHISGHKYITALLEYSKCIAFQIPSMGKNYNYSYLVDHFDGILLTGGRANIEPHYYGGEPFPDGELIDPERDSTVLELIPICIKLGVPLFGICRGLQEINVAMGGSLHYRIHKLPGKNDHRMPKGNNIDDQEIYALRHPITLTKNGFFHKLSGKSELNVNSLHGQGIDRLGQDLAIEAISDDNIIEGIRIINHPNFGIAVQWHAEYQPGQEDHRLSRCLYEAFGHAARQRMLNR
ncbi:MAG: hypothetical protein CMM67_10635 [Rhodospirillaceae bacterium]|nr:hypothetical protein [Rhodospirillaceae bacterium]OUT76527.1 MAG: hypothetical protein CBB83_10815 [Rhodospirillaceae bacterium TMED23]